MASSCYRKFSSWILGIICFQKEQWGIETDCPGRWWSLGWEKGGCGTELHGLEWLVVGLGDLIGLSYLNNSILRQVFLREAGRMGRAELPPGAVEVLYGRIFASALSYPHTPQSCIKTHILLGAQRFLLSSRSKAPSTCAVCCASETWHSSRVQKNIPDALWIFMIYEYSLN